MSIPFTSYLQPVESNILKSDNNITFRIDQQKPMKSKLMWTSDLQETTFIRMGTIGAMAREKPLTMHTLMVKAVDRGAKLIAFKYKFSHKDRYKSITFGEYYRLTAMVAKSLIRAGLEKKNTVCISGYNSPAWFLSYMGTIFAGGIVSGLFTSNDEDTIEYILKNCSCQIAIVEDNELLLKYLVVSRNVPKLKAIIQYSGKISYDIRHDSEGINLYDWSEFMNLGLNVSDESLIDRLQNLVPNECCSIVYTSGTTGNPKGVMMSHDNLVWTSKCLMFHLNLRPAKEHFLSYLPLSHVAAQMTDVIVPLQCQSTVWFSMPDALKGTLGKSLQEVRPTWFIGVPRVWEKIAEQMKELAINMSLTTKGVSDWAKGIGLKTNLAISNNEPIPFGYSLAKIVAFNKVRSKLGFDRCLGLFSAAAPISLELIHYFASLDLVICEIYGMSETTGPHSVGLHSQVRFGTVGKPLTEFLHKIDNSELGSKEGEVCMSGRQIFMGYVGEPEKTKAAFDADNYLRSGDIGTVDSDGYLTITGRIKELIITTSGVNISPIFIENNIKEKLPLISNAMVIGDKRKFLVVLLTIKCEINPKSQYPTDTLTATAKRWCKSINYQATNVSEIISDRNPKVWAVVDEAIAAINKKAPNTSHVRKWSFLPCDFSVGGGELGPTMKVKRLFVQQMYWDLIEELYKE